MAREAGPAMVEEALEDPVGDGVENGGTYTLHDFGTMQFVQLSRCGDVCTVFGDERAFSGGPFDLLLFEGLPFVASRQGDDEAKALHRIDGFFAHKVLSKRLGPSMPFREYITSTASSQEIERVWGDARE